MFHLMILLSLLDSLEILIWGKAVYSYAAVQEEVVSVSYLVRVTNEPSNSHFSILFQIARQRSTE